MVGKSFYTIKNYKAFQRLLYKKVKILAYITSFLLFALGGTLIYFGYFGYTYLIFGAALPIFVHFVIKFLENENIKKNVLLRRGAEQIFCFEDDGVNVKQTSQLGVFEDKYYYKEILSVYKNKEYYFLFVTRTQAFVMERNCLVDSTEEELDAFFKEKFGKTFKNKAR